MTPPGGTLPACLVTGATGTLGGQVVRHLLTHGAPEVHVAIRPNSTMDARERFEHFRRASSGRDRLHLLPVGETGPIDLPDGVGAVIHCAALVDFVDERDVIESNVVATWHLLCAAARAPAVTKFLHTSSLSIRTDTSGSFSESDLDTGQSFVSPYTLSKFLAETMIRKLHRPLPVTTVRVGTVLPDAGEDVCVGSDWFRNTVRLWASGRLSCIPLGPDQHVYPVVASDLARMIVQMLAIEALPPVVHLPPNDGPPASRIFELMSQSLRLPPPRLLSQHSAEWEHHRQTLPDVVRRVIDGLYPPPPPGHRLARVDSTTTARWIETHGLTCPTVPDRYWTDFARTLAPLRRKRSQDTAPREEAS